MASGNIKKFEMKLKKPAIIIIITGAAALICFAFLLGVDVGKNIDTYPEKIAELPRKALSYIWNPSKVESIKNEEKSQQEEPGEDENIGLTYHNTLTSKKGMAKEQPVAQKKDDKEAAPQAVVPLENNSDDISKEDAALEAQKKSAAVKEKPKDEGKPKAKEPPASASAPKQKFIIQVASLKEKNKAYQLNKKISALGFEALIVPIEIKGKGIWYRVTVSGFESKAQAQAAAVKISKKTGTNCIIRNADSTVKKN